MNYNNQRGASALYVVLIVSAIAFIFAGSATFSSLGALEEEAADNGRLNASILAAGCFDEVLRRIDLNNDLELSGYSLPIGAESCIISVIKSGSERNIVIEGISTDYHQRLAANVELSAAGSVIKNYNFVDLD